MIWLAVVVSIAVVQYTITKANYWPHYENLAYVNGYLTELFEFGWSYWNHRLAFGVPDLIQANYVAHPATILVHLMFGEVDAAVLVALLTAIGVPVFYLLCRALAMRVELAVVCTVTFYLSEVSARYLLSGWESVLTQTVVWTFVPVYFYALIRLVTAEARPQKLFWCIAFATLYGLTYINGHVGEMTTLTAALAVFMLATLVAAPRLLPYFVLAGVAIVLISLWKNTFLLEQRAFYPFDVPRESEQPMTLGYYNDMFWGLFLRPLVSPATDAVLAALAQGDLPGAVKAYVQEYYTVNMNRRWLFFGGPFAVIGIFAVVTRTRLHWLHRSLAVAFLFAVVANCMPVEVWGKLLAVPQLWSEPVTFFGILLAGVALQGVSERRAGDHGPAFARSILVWQMAVVVLAMGPRWVNFLVDQPADQFAAHTPGGLERTIRDLADKDGTIRVYLGPQADKITSNRVDRYFETDINRVTVDVIPPALPRFYPFKMYMHGRIDGDADTLVNRPLLDVMGIDILIAGPEDTVPEGVTLLGTYDWFQQDRFRIYRNDTAWPLVSVVDPGLRQVGSLPRRSSCPHDRLMCADFSPVHHARDTNQAADFAWYGDRLDIGLPASDRVRTLLVTQAFWDQWLAESADGRTLEVFPLLEAFVGIEVPPGVTDLSLAYVDTRYRHLTTLMLGTFAVCLLAMVLLAVVNRRKKPTSAPQTGAGQ